MTRPVPAPIDFNSYKKAWHSDLIKSDASEIDHLISNNPLLHETLLLRDSAMAVKDIRRMSYSCIMGDVEKVCGWDRQLFLTGGVGFLISQIPLPELKGLEEMTRLINEYVVTLTDSQTARFRAIFDFKLTRSDGTTSRIIQESVVLKRDAEGNILFFLALVSNITNLKRDGRQHLRLTNGEENILYQLDNCTEERVVLEDLSKRELEIARMLGQNFSSEAIGEKLFISTNTVNTHRQHILRKLGMKDTMELISFLNIYRML